MTHDSAVVTRFGGVLVAGALTVAAAAGVGCASEANATCASILGIGNNANCTSNFTSIAIAIGVNASAHADDLFGASYAFGKNATAKMAGGDVFNLAVAFGESAQAQSGGVLSTAVSIGQNARTIAGSAGNIANLAVDLGNRSPGGGVLTDGYLNLALNVFGGTTVKSSGIGNAAVNALGKDSFVNAYGRFNNATNFVGSNNVINGLVPVGGSTFTSAFSNFGRDNQVGVGKGPLIIAGSILQRNSNVAKLSPGININGFKIGGAATESRGRAVPAAATATSSLKPAVTVRSAQRAAAATRKGARGAD